MAPSMNDLTDEIKGKLKRMPRYDQRVFDIVCLQGISMLQLSGPTGISSLSHQKNNKKSKSPLKMRNRINFF